MQANICMLVGTVLIYTAAQAAPSASASCWSKAVLGVREAKSCSWSTEDRGRIIARVGVDQASH